MSLDLDSHYVWDGSKKERSTPNMVNMNGFTNDMKWNQAKEDSSCNPQLIVIVIP